MDTKTSLAVTAGGGVVSVPFAYITHRVLTR